MGIPVTILCVFLAIWIILSREGFIIISIFWDELNAFTRVQTQHLSRVVNSSDPLGVHEATPNAFLFPLLNSLLNLLGSLFELRLHHCLAASHLRLVVVCACIFIVMTRRTGYSVVWACSNFFSLWHLRLGQCRDLNLACYGSCSCSLYPILHHIYFTLPGFWAN